MFSTAIDTALRFTRPIHFVSRYYESPEVHPGAATLFFVNMDGWALTCKHVVSEIVGANTLTARHKEFKEKWAALHGEKNSRASRRALEKSYGYTKDSVVELLATFFGCVEGTRVEFDWWTHPVHDLGLIRTKGKPLYDGVAVFPKTDDPPKAGSMLCRLGYPFPEFSNYKYDEVADSVSWTTEGRQDTPQFPIEGMVTRHVVDASGGVLQFEMSTPGLRGQSGGPAFDTTGVVWGMQASTFHLDLDFDVDQRVTRGRKKVAIKESAFLHVGRCITAKIMKEFMREKGVGFTES